MLPTHGERHAVTVWYYDMEERVQSIADAKRHAAERMEEAANTRTRAIEAPDAPASSGGKKSKKKAIKAQEEARAFIQEIMKVRFGGGGGTRSIRAPGAVSPCSRRC